MIIALFALLVLRFSAFDPCVVGVVGLYVKKVEEDFCRAVCVVFSTDSGFLGAFSR